MSEWGRKIGEEIVAAAEAELAKDPQPPCKECERIRNEYAEVGVDAWAICRECAAKMEAELAAGGGTYGPGI